MTFPLEVCKVMW